MTEEGKRRREEMVSVTCKKYIFYENIKKNT